MHRPDNTTPPRRDQRTGRPRKRYVPPVLTSDKVFALDALGGCRMASYAESCGRYSQYYLSSV